MKTLIALLTSSILLINFCIYGQDDENPPVDYEVGFHNGSTRISPGPRDLILIIYPVSMIMNGLNFYDLHTPFYNADPQYNYLTTLSAPFYSGNVLHQGGDRDYQHERAAQINSGAWGIFGYGIYKIEFKWGDGADTCLVEFDAGTAPDLSFLFYDDPPGGGPRIIYNWNGSCGDRNITATNRYIKSWEWNWCGTTRDKDPGNFIYTDDPNNSYTMLPQDFRQDCGTESNDTEYLDNFNRTGVLSLNLTIDKPVETRTFANSGFERLGTPNQIVISPSSTLKVNGGQTLTVKYDPEIEVSGQENWYSKLIVQPNAWLYLNQANAQIIVEKTNWLVLNRESNLYIGNGSIVDLRPKSTLCDYGAHIRGAGKFRIVGVLIPCSSSGDFTETVFSDSVIVQLSDTAILQIPDSTTWRFEGNETVLTCDSGSAIKFGKGSKMIFTDGARINAKHTKFTTYDSNTTWNGIYLSDVSYDTLQYCTIENALNGINVENKYSLFTGSPATEISNCEFSNKTSDQMLNMVYVNNSRNVMIRSCTSSSLISDGFASGVIMEYCPAGAVSVIDNALNYVTTGINVIQSSPYVARNIITGAGSEGTGIYCDNSNGTIEYNLISNFENSATLYYSSPYMLKNTMSNAANSCAYLTAKSLPVMRPIVSGSTLRWLGGNNFFSGNPQTAGIIIEDESFPMMDSGYNVMSVNSSLYMQGVISKELKLRVNNWNDNPPQSYKFDISGDDVDYSQDFDGQSLPGTDYFETSSIGFGYYDSVYVKSLGDNSSAEDMFIQAYLKEMESSYSEAITLYKDVVSTYKTSDYAVTSLSRIFNCLEKSNANNSGYSAIKTYYDDLKNSNNYPVQVRELSEDLSIKSKVRMGYLEDAIADYQTIINNSPNAPKGIHAQINKMCLLNMSEGGDMIMSPNKLSKENYKASLLALITGKKLQTANKITNNIPRQFKLYQNYPNPFNPKTSIRYEIPKDAQVTLAIYDITGREVLNINEYKQAGSYTYTFDGANYASGLYLYRIESGSFVETKKMVLLK